MNSIITIEPVAFKMLIRVDIARTSEIFFPVKLSEAGSLLGKYRYKVISF